MQHPDQFMAGARGSSDVGFSFGDEHQVSSISDAPLQAIPETEAEPLAWGYGNLPADHLIACRAMWMRLRMRGVPLPAERRIILIAGGRHDG